MAFAYVQGAKAENLSPVATGITATLGNVLVVFGFINQNGLTLTISDTQGNVWTASAATVSPGVGTSARMWWAIAKNSLATTITIAGGASNGAIVVAEYSGNDQTASAGDGGTGQAGTNTGAVDGVTTGNVLTTAAGDLIVGAVVNTTSLSAFNAGTGETNRPNSSFLVSTFGMVSLEDKEQGAAGNIASTWTLAANADTYIAFEQAIKAPAAVGGGPPFAGGRTIYKIAPSRWG